MEILFYWVLFGLGVSKQLGDPVNPSNSPEIDRPPPEPINLTVSSTLPPTRPDPFGSASRFPPQKPEPLDPTIKSTKSGKIQMFSDKELLEIHCNPLDPAIFLIFQWRAAWNQPNLSRSNLELTDSAKYQPDLDQSGQISAPVTKYRHRLQNPKPTDNLPETDNSNWVIRPLKRVGFEPGHKLDPWTPLI